jgi:diadenosine tetraphosphatase ApaH/serine/threonine PP2A family protein phosphatase
MKYAVIADIHANLEARQVVIEKAYDLGCERFLCLGDVIGYNANPCECIELIRGLPLEACVRGNHDDYACSDADLSGFNPQAAWAIEWTREHVSDSQREWLDSLTYQQLLNPKVTLVHATLDMPKSWGYIFDKWHAAASFNYQYTQLCFSGHTHVPVIFHKFGQVTAEQLPRIHLEPGHKYLINVGSVGQPRDGDPRASFGVFDAEDRTVELQRVAYDIEACQTKIRRAGLPERLAARLATGR